MNIDFTDAGLLVDLKYAADGLSDAVVGYKQGQVLASYIASLGYSDFKMSTILLEDALEKLMLALPDTILIENLQSRGYNVNAQEEV